MSRPLSASLLALLWIQTPVLAQTASGCETSLSVEVSIWRGLNSSPDVAYLPEQICATTTMGAVQAEEPLPATPWGVPGLEEIAALVLSSPEVERLSEPPPTDPEQPPVLSGADVASPTGSGQPSLRTVIVSAGPDGETMRILHLRIIEASPGLLDVSVQAGAQRPLRLVWTRSPQAPEWAPA